MIDTEPKPLLTNESDNVQVISTTAYPNIKATVRLFFVVIFYMIICSIPTVILLAGQHLGSTAILSLVNLMQYAITMLFIIKYAVKKSRKQQTPPFNFNFSDVQWRLVPVIMLSTIALVVGLEWISDLLPMPRSVQSFFANAFRKDILTLITLVIAAPILEEILCRGIVLQGLLKNYTPLKAILISAVFFGLIHLNPWQALPAFFGGLFLGWVYYRTQSIIPGMIIHATINGTGAFFIFLPTHEQTLSGLLGMRAYIILCLVSALVFIAGCLIIHKKTVPSQHDEIYPKKSSVDATSDNNSSLGSISSPLAQSSSANFLNDSND